MQKILWTHTWKQLFKNIPYGAIFVAYYLIISNLADFAAEGVTAAVANFVLMALLGMSLLLGAVPYLPKALFIMPVTRADRENYVKNIIKTKFYMLLGIIVIVEGVMFIFCNATVATGIGIAITSVSLFICFNFWNYFNMNFESAMILAEPLLMIVDIVMFIIIWGEGQMLKFDLGGIIILMICVFIFVMQILIVKKYGAKMIATYSDYEAMRNMQKTLAKNSSRKMEL